MVRKASQLAIQARTDAAMFRFYGSGAKALAAKLKQMPSNGVSHTVGVRRSDGHLQNKRRSVYFQRKACPNRKVRKSSFERKTDFGSRWQSKWLAYPARACVRPFLKRRGASTRRARALSAHLRRDQVLAAWAISRALSA